MTIWTILGVLAAAVALFVASVVLVVRATRSRPARGGAARGGIDPFAVAEPWRRPTSDALAARRRFDAAVTSMDPGPLRDRLVEVGLRLDDGVAHLWDVARDGNALSSARRRIDTASLERRLSSAPDEATAAALRSQIDTAGRIDATIADTERRLTRLVARFEQASTEVEELAATSGGGVDALDAEVTDTVSEVAALRDALDEARAAGGQDPPPEPDTAAGAP